MAYDSFIYLPAVVVGGYKKYEAIHPINKRQKSIIIEICTRITFLALANIVPDFVGGLHQAGLVVF